MSVQTEITVTLAEVEVTDDYQVAVKLRRREVYLSPDEAVQLASELMNAAREADDKVRADMPSRVTFLHAFDIAPTCRECGEGKHGACIGSAWVERGSDMDEVECGCSKAGHPAAGDAA